MPVFGTIIGGYSLIQREISAKRTAERDLDGFVIEGFHRNGSTALGVTPADISEILSHAIVRFLEAKNVSGTFYFHVRTATSSGRKTARSTGCLDTAVY